MEGGASGSNTSHLVEGQSGTRAQAVSLGFHTRGRSQMTRFSVVTAGVVATMLATPVMAQEAIQEPGPMAQNFPDSDYLTGGYGVHASPGPRYYYWRHHYYGPGPAGLPAGVVVGAVGPAIATVPLGDGYGPYAYYYGPPY
jgi:hypothetical protein